MGGILERVNQWLADNPENTRRRYGPKDAQDVWPAVGGQDRSPIASSSSTFARSFIIGGRQLANVGEDGSGA
jgi:hypothetical protein